MTTNGGADKGFQHVDGNHHVKNENGIMVGFLGENELMINEVDENVRKNELEQVVHPQVSLVASVSMTINGGADKGFQHVDGNHHVKNENGIVVGFPGDNELINEVDENVRKNEPEQVVYPQVSMQVSQPQPQGSLAHWERFLHVQSIKVMLVENDDSTRQIVAALLRNCNYEVIEAVNGFQAWKILEDISNHIDIVLTEVVMPCLSGISLLCKIMSHKTRKNIPVIMMSSHDSVGLVFKCLSKGAVDFLVKPIRKNELKNLWQHVWRRCHSSSGSGSESGSHFQRSVNSKSSIKSAKGSEPSDSNVGDNDGNTGSGSDDVSGTQSSWTKQAVEGDRPQAAPPQDQTTEHSENVTKGGLAIGRPKIFESPMSVVEVPLKLEGEKEIIEELDPAHNRRNDKGLANCTGDHLSNKHKLVNINMCPEEHGESEDLREPEKIMETNPKAIDDCKEVAVLEPSTKDAGRAIKKKLNALRQTTVAAFTRYDTASNSFKASHRTVRSSSEPDNSLKFVKKESMHGVRAHSDGYLIYQNSNDIGNSIDVASSTNKLSTNHVIQKEKPEARFAVNCSQPSSSLQPIETDDTCSSLQGLLAKVGDITTTYGLDPPRDMHQDLPSVQHIHHHHHVHHYHDMDGQQPLSNHDDLSLKEFATDAPHYGSSSTAEVNPEKYSLNRSASGSKRGSNAQIGNSTAIDVVGANVESDVGLAWKSGSGYASGSKTGNIIEQQKSAQKPAALTSCHRKRMEQCFQKKVRYQNRKRLSEQRPRARGKFVRQTGRDSSNDAAQS